MARLRRAAGARLKISGPQANSLARSWQRPAGTPVWAGGRIAKWCGKRLQARTHTLGGAILPDGSAAGSRTPRSPESNPLHLVSLTARARRSSVSASVQMPGLGVHPLGLTKKEIGS